MHHYMTLALPNFLSSEKDVKVALTRESFILYIHHKSTHKNHVIV